MLREIGEGELKVMLILSEIDPLFIIGIKRGNEIIHLKCVKSEVKMISCPYFILNKK